MGEILETECKECKDNRCYFMGVGESCIDTLIKLAAKDYHFLGHSMTKDAFSRMDAIIQNLSSTPHIHEELEVQECAACNVTYSHYHVHFEYGEGGYFSSREPCKICQGKLIKATKKLDQYCCLNCGKLTLSEGQSGIWD